MFILPSLPGLIAEATLAKQAAELERQRWAGLTPEQRAEELRLREVRVLERLAQPQEIHVHHHFF